MATMRLLYIVYCVVRCALRLHCKVISLSPGAILNQPEGTPRNAGQLNFLFYFAKGWNKHREVVPIVSVLVE